MNTKKQHAPDAVLIALNMLNEVYAGRFVITDGIVDLWRTMLEGFSPDIIRAAVMHLVSTRVQQWPPTIAEVRATALNLQAGRLCDVSAEEAWIQVQPYIQGQQTDKGRLSPLLQQALRFCGGVEGLGRSTDVERDRRTFVRAYEALKVKAIAERLTLPAVRTVADQHRLLAQPSPPKK